MEDKPKEILELERALGIDHVDYYKWDGEKVTKLKINYKGIKDISPLKYLTTLMHLDLSGNQITDISPLQGLHDLTSLVLFSNQISDLSPLQELIGLIELNLSQNHIIDLSMIKGLNRLKSLSLWNIQITDISALQGLHSLTELNLSQNQISDLSPLKELHGLTLLRLSRNEISNLLPLKRLTYLTELDLSQNQISNLSPLKDLDTLTSLKLSENKISDLSPLKRLIGLTSIDLSGNIISDLSPLKELNQLVKLDLGDNQIANISPLKGLQRLKSLGLASNQITDLSPLKTFLENGLKLSLKEINLKYNTISINLNPITVPSIEILKKKNAKVLMYLEQYDLELQKGTRPINEAKMIIIGEPESGKTTLMNYLQGKPFTVPSTTQGFTIEQWTIKENNTDYRINIWDFGGQDIQSTVHQFFLTQDTLYLMVLNARKDELPDKYIEQIKSYAPDSPIIIVVNRIEENPSYEMGVKRLQETHKDKDGISLIKGVFKVSLLKGHKDLDPSYFSILEEMKQAIQKTLLEMPHIHRSVPITYLAVKEYLESAFFADKPYISHDTYEQICREKGLNIESNDDLLGYLNNLGTVRYFDDLSLRNLQILNPEWLSDGVYRILVDGRTKQLRGIITERDFDTILQKTEENQFEYPKKHYNYLIQMIRKFDMGHYDEETKRIFIPRAFGLDYIQNFNSTLYKNEAIHFFFRYESFIPSTIMPAFISRMFGLVKDQLYSQNGVVLEQNGQFALVEQTTIKNRIDIWVSGDKSKGEYFEFFLEIRKVFREFHEKRPGLVVDEMIGLGKNSDVSVKYKQLIANKINNVSTYIGEDGTPYNIDELLGRFESKNNTVQYITEQNNYHVGGDMYSGQIYLLKHHTNELLELLKQNKANFSEEKHEEIDRMISELEKVETVPTDKTASKGFLQQLNETRKNIGKIMSEEGVKWFTKSALDGKFNETIMNVANKVMQGLQNPMLRDFVDNGSNMM